MAEAIVRLRGIYFSGDFDSYWAFHITQDQRRLYLPGRGTVVVSTHTRLGTVSSMERNPHIPRESRSDYFRRDLIDTSEAWASSAIAP